MSCLTCNHAGRVDDVFDVKCGTICTTAERFMEINAGVSNPNFLLALECDALSYFRSCKRPKKFELVCPASWFMRSRTSKVQFSCDVLVSVVTSCICALQSFDECVLGNYSECMAPLGDDAEEGYFNIIPFFCGQEAVCRSVTGSRL